MVFRGGRDGAATEEPPRVLPACSQRLPRNFLVTISVPGRLRQLLEAQPASEYGGALCLCINAHVL